MRLIDMDRLRKELMAKGDIPMHEVFNTIWDQPIVNICEVEEQQPCEDCISREAVLEYIEGSEAELGHSSENELVRQDIKKLPSVTPQPRIGHWEWIQYDSNPNIGNWHCSECRGICTEMHSIEDAYNYCPNCGAKMEVEENG